LRLAEVYSPCNTLQQQKKRKRIIGTEALDGELKGWKTIVLKKQQQNISVQPGKIIN
jgi:hypothetical protein